jgi:hypothetical protein
MTPKPENVKWTYWRAVRSFLRGHDGLSDWDQIDRNLTIAGGNIIFAAVMIALSMFIRALAPLLHHAPIICIGRC